MKRMSGEARIYWSPSSHLPVPPTSLTPLTKTISNCTPMVSSRLQLSAGGEETSGGLLRGVELQEAVWRHSFHHLVPSLQPHCVSTGVTTQRSAVVALWSSAQFLLSDWPSAPGGGYQRIPALTLISSRAAMQLDRCPYQASLEIWHCKMAAFIALQ